jgi:hypothetical protein
MSNRNRFKSTTGLNDLLFNLLIGFVFLFVVAFLLINPPTKKSDAPKKAEYLIVIEWDKDANHDVDLWVKDPTGVVVSFTNKMGGLLNLEKDDLGWQNDKWIQPNGSEVIIPINREVITIRGIVPGEYKVAAHVYSKKIMYSINTSNGKYIKTEIEDSGYVTATLIRINPYGEVYKTRKIYTQKGQVLSMFNFILDANGDVTSLDERSNSIVTRGGRTLTGSGPDE